MPRSGRGCETFLPRPGPGIEPLVRSWGEESAIEALPDVDHPREDADCFK